MSKGKDKEQMMEMTKLSIESRKPGGKNENAGKKQAVTNACKSAFWESNTRTTYQNKHLKEPVYNYLIEQMFGKDGKWIKDYIDSQLKEARSNPNSRAAERISGGLFNEHLWNELNTYLQLSNKEDNDYTRYLIRQTLYDKQQEVFDNDIDNTILIINSRRSGKTELMGRIIAKGLLRPDAHVVYINRSSSAAIRQIRKPLASALEATNGRLRIIKGSVESQEVHFNNGGQLLVIGNNNASDTDKMRGERISLCIMDECAHQRYTRTLLREVIRPAMIDYEGSQLIMVGTPPRIPRTYVEEMWNNPRTKRYHWTFESNPFIPNKENVIKDVCEEYGVTEDSAFIQREYYGRMDAYDSDAQVFHGYKLIDKPIDHITHAYVGVDWGFEDKAAVVGVVADQQGRKACVVRTWSESHTSVSKTCEEVRKMREYLLTFHPTHPVQIICDNNAKQDVYELVETYKLPNVTTAYKYDKDLAIEQLAEWLRSGTIVTVNKDNDRLIEDYNYTMWLRDEETDKLLHEIDDDLYHPNAAMALLYCSRQFDYDCMVTGYSKTAMEIIDEVLKR